MCTLRYVGVLEKMRGKKFAQGLQMPHTLTMLLVVLYTHGRQVYAAALLLLCSLARKMNENTRPAGYVTVMRTADADAIRWKSLRQVGV